MSALHHMKKLSEINLADLTPEEVSDDLRVVKYGKELTPREIIIDPFVIGHMETVRITGQDIRKHNSYVSAVFDVDILTRGPATVSGGKIEVSLPIMPEDAAPIPTAHMHRIRKSFLYFLQAVAPDKYRVIHQVDDTSKPWKYYDVNGVVISAADREVKGKLIESRLVPLAVKYSEGGISFVGCRANVIKVPNHKNPAYPYSNWSPEGPLKHVVPDGEAPF